MIDFRIPVRRDKAAALAVTGVLLALAGCSASSGGGSSAGATTASASGSGPAGHATPGAARITVTNFTFGPASLTVRPGTRVSVLNRDSTAHTVTATGPGSFDTGDIAPGGSATFTAPDKAGTYPYMCAIHQFMKGTLTVG